MIEDCINSKATNPRKAATRTAAISSALPWPKGCSLSGGLLESLAPAITIMELNVSERVCHASAIMATEPETTPAQYFNTKSALLTMMEIQPS